MKADMAARTEPSDLLHENDGTGMIAVIGIHVSSDHRVRSESDLRARVFTISHLAFSSALGVSDVEILTGVVALTGRFSRFPGGGYSFY